MLNSRYYLKICNHHARKDVVQNIENVLEEWEQFGTFLNSLPNDLKGHERITIEFAKQSLRDEHLDELAKLLEREYGSIREGETVLTDLNNDGQYSLYNIQGKRHARGGTPLFLPEQSFVFSDFNKMKLTKEEMADMGMETKKRLTPAKVSKTRRRRPRGRKTSLTFTRRFIGTIKNFFSKISTVLLRPRAASFTQPRLSFGRVALESAVTGLTIFLLSIILLSVLVYPRLFTDFAVEFYSTTSHLQGFMQALANALVPIASGLNSIAPSFRNAFGGLVTSQSLTGGNLLWRYAFCQSASALVSAISALAYVRYIIKPHRSSK